MVANMYFSEAEVAALCKRHRIRRLSFFGSVVRPDFGPDSDVDLLVEFEPGCTPGWEIVDIAEDFSRLFGGRKVELINPKYLNNQMRSQVLESAVVQYESFHGSQQ